MQCLKRAGSLGRLKFQCSDCFNGKKKVPGRYIRKLWTFYAMKEAGADISINALTIDEWIDIKLLKETLMEIWRNNQL